MLSLINLQSTKNQSAKEGDPRRQPHSSENWCRPSGTRFVSTLLPGTHVRAFLCRRFAPGTMAQSAAPSKLSVNQLSQSPPSEVYPPPSRSFQSRPGFTAPIAGPDQWPAFLLASAGALNSSLDRPARAARSTLAPDAKLEPPAFRADTEFAGSCLRPA